MGERKVLNKYYPPDFDPSKLPKGPPRPTQYVVRLMAPFTMRCLTCGNYVYKGKKFNSRKEDAVGEKYLGIQIYRFYIRCPECLSEITFKTDPENSDYAVEHGAIRTFQAERLAELEEQRELEEKEEEEANNPMLALENRTAESRREMDVLDALEEIRDWNARNASVKHEELLERLITSEKEEEEKEEEALSALAQKIFAKKRGNIRRLEEEEEAPPTKLTRVDDDRPSKQLPSKLKLAGLVRRREKTETDKTRDSEPISSSREGGGGEEVNGGQSCEPAASSLGLLCAYSSNSSSEEEGEGGD